MKSFKKRLRKAIKASPYPVKLLIQKELDIETAKVNSKAPAWLWGDYDIDSYNFKNPQLVRDCVYLIYASGTMGKADCNLFAGSGEKYVQAWKKQRETVDPTKYFNAFAGFLVSTLVKTLIFEGGGFRDDSYIEPFCLIYENNCGIRLGEKVPRAWDINRTSILFDEDNVEFKANIGDLYV